MNYPMIRLLEKNPLIKQGVIKLKQKGKGYKCGMIIPQYIN